MTPDGWTETKMKAAFSSRKEKGEAGLPVLSVTLRDGLKRRDALDRKMDSELAPEGHLRIRKGDIAYNMMRMWQGASGQAQYDGIVSPAYVVLAPTPEVDSDFMAYLLKHDRTIYDLWAYSYGLTSDRLRLYFNDFCNVPLSLPPLVEQKKIAKILSIWDRAIETTEKLIENAGVQKKALMQQLLTAQKRLPGFSSKWQSIRLNDVAKIISSNVDKKTVAGQPPVKLCNYTDVYYNAFITHDIDFMDASASPAEIARFSLRKDDVIITKDSESPDDIAIPAYVSEDLSGVLCGYHLTMLRPKANKVSGEFLASVFLLPKVQYYFATRANGATRFGLSVDSISDAEMMFPSFEEQLAIASVIRAADHEILAHRAELNSLQAQRRALMQQLLTGKRRVKLDGGI